MEPDEYSIDVGQQESTEHLLARLEALPEDAHVRLNMPRDVVTLRSTDDFNALRDLQRRRKLHLAVASPESTILGLARIYGFGMLDTAPPKAVAVPMPAGDEADTMPRWRTPAAPRRAEEVAAAHDRVAAPAASRAATPAEPPAPAPHTARPPNGAAATDTSTAVPAGSGTLHADEAAPDPLDAPASVVVAPGTPPPAGRLPSRGAAAIALAANGAPAAEPAALPPLAAESAAPAAGRPVADNTRGSRAPNILGAAAPAAPERRPGAAAPGAAERAAASAPPGTGLDAVLTPAAVAGVATAAPAVAEAGGPVTVARPLPMERTAARPVPVQTRRRSRRGAGLLALLVILLILFGLGAIAVLNLSPALATATITLAPRAPDAVGPVTVDVPVLTTGQAAGARPGLAAPAPQVSGTLALTPTAPAGAPPVTATLPVTATAPGAPGPDMVLQAPPVQAQKITTTITAAQTIPTTGSRQQPDKTAVGAVQFTNTGSSPVFIPANTTIVAYNLQLRFHTVQGVTVPGTDFFAQRFGNADADVAADAPGPASNGALFSGTAGGGAVVVHTLRQSGGGTTVTIKTVTEQNVADLQAALKGVIDARAGQQVLAQVPAGMTPITCTLPVGSAAGNYAVSRLPTVGSDADAIGGVMTATASVYAFNPGAAQQQAMQVAQTLAPTGNPLVQSRVDPASIQVGDLTRSGGCDNGRVVYSTQVAARLVSTTTLDSTVLDQIKEQVRGKTVAEARTALADSPYAPYLDLSRLQIQSRLLNFTQDKLPDTPANINIQLAPLAGAAPAVGGSGDSATPDTSGSPAPATAAPAGASPTGEPK